MIAVTLAWNAVTIPAGGKTNLIETMLVGSKNRKWVYRLVWSSKICESLGLKLGCDWDETGKERKRNSEFGMGTCCCVDILATVTEQAVWISWVCDCLEKGTLDNRSS